MVTGLGVLIVAGMGIVCGWQPMPDGDASYECVIQLEPELVSTLKGGNSIPLSVDVPDHVQPIKRVRILVGSGPVPQQNLVTNLKPLPGNANKQSREGIVEAQYTFPNNPVDNRYATQAANTQPVLPPNDYASNAQEAFARSLQNGGQGVRDAASQATQDILPPDPGRSISDAVDRTGQQLGSGIRNVGDNVRSDIRQLFGGEPSSGNGVAPPQGIGTQDSQILPPGSTPAANNDLRMGTADNGQAILPPGENQSQNNRRVDQPLGVSPGGDWQSRGNAGTERNTTDSRNTFNGVGTNNAPSNYDNLNYNTTPGGFRPETTGGSPPAFNARNSSVVPQSEQYPDSIQAPQRGSLDIADSRSGIPASGLTADSGPGFPAFTPTQSSDSGLARPATPSYQNPSSGPEIRRNMLDVPAGAELQGANGLPIAQQNPDTSAGNSQPPASQTDFNWNTQPQSQPQPAQATVQAGTNPAPMFPLLLSWVLLSGSGAGNLYLFWSYLDIRNKYRDVLYDVSRKISGRNGRD